MWNVTADTGRRYRLYPTQAQAQRLMSWGHTCRWLYNTALEQRQFAWQQRKISLGGVRPVRLVDPSA